jgi:hypothetical protein
MTLYFPPQTFKAGARLSKPEWQRRYKQFAVADFAEGARRDAFQWGRYREPFWVRAALPAEYDGARLNAGLAIADHKHAVVISRAANGKIARLFLPLESTVDLESFAPQHWWEVATDWDNRTLNAVVHDAVPLVRGAA